MAGSAEVKETAALSAVVEESVAVSPAVEVSIVSGGSDVSTNPAEEKEEETNEFLDNVS